MRDSEPNVVHWNVSKINGPSYGTAKYERRLWEELRRVSGSIDRIQRPNGKLSGSMPLSWLKRFKTGDYDLVHATFQTVAPAGLFHRPDNFVVTVHDLAPLVYTNEQRDLSLKLQWNATPPALRRADRLIAISEFTKSEIQRLMDIPESKISVVRQGIDRKLYYPQDQAASREHFDLEPDMNYILVVSSDLEHKRIDTVNKVLDRVRETDPNTKVLKAGYGQNLQGEHVVNTGWVSEEDMPKLYSAADVYLHPSEYEGFGLPVLEAIACGTPVVARNVASIPEIVGKTTDLVPPDASVQTFADHVIRQMRWDSPVADLVERSRQFTWEDTATETREVYESVLG